MVKNLLLLIIMLLIGCLSYCQSCDLWWLRTSENIVYEKNYDNIFFEVKDGVLKNEILNFINTYQLNSKKSNKDKAIIVTVLFVDTENNSCKYQITYESDYYTLVYNRHEIQNVSKLDNKMVFFKNPYSSYIYMNKEFLYGLLRSNFPILTKQLNEEYIRNLEVGEGITPTIISRLEHQIPYWLITLKDNKVIERAIIID